MKKYRLLSALLALVILTALSGVQGQYPSGYSAPNADMTAAPSYGAAPGNTTMGNASQVNASMRNAAQGNISMGSAVQGNASMRNAAQGNVSMGVGQVNASAGNVAQYSQFFTTPTGAVPTTHISAPAQFDIAGRIPITVLLGTQGQVVSYNVFQSNPANAGNSYLWIQGTTEWTQYAVVPQGAIVQLIAIPPTPGNGILYLIDTDGQVYPDNYYFFPYSQMTFYADKPGRHVLYFVVNGKVSNNVIIDVTGTYTPPSNYMPPRYPYYPYYYPGYFISGMPSTSTPTASSSESGASERGESGISLPGRSGESGESKGHD